MDIENMHPFCLPFSLCHDATSSSITDDISSTLLHNKDNDRSNKTSASSNNNNDSSIENNRPRSKGATSPMEDIFNRFDASLSPPSNRSLLQDECLIDSSNTYNALHLDIDMVTNLNDSHETCASEFGLNDDGATESLCKNDDWFSTTTTPSTHDCSLFSPIDSITDSLTKQRKYLKGAYYSALNNNNNNNQHHQVFHVVDPIDIKSSPTLAQLNLNSNDDPTDNLWDTNSSTATATLSISTRAQTPNLFSDLLSSCINGAPMRSCINNNGLTTCSHQIHNQQANSATAPYAPHQGNSQLSPLCHHLYHHHHHNHMGNNGRCNSSQTQSTCLAVAPFRKNVDLQRAITHNHSSCCVNHHHHSHNQNYHVHSQSYLGNSSIASQQANCADHQKLMTAANSHCNSNELLAPRQQLTTASIDNHQRHHHNHHQQQQQFKSQHQRCSSPAPLVTSSSSPLSSSLAQNMPNDTRLTDNKLKENIEYLTVLLCSGNNKLDKQTNPQQSSISSTIVKPYSTLAQSLSTEPKLLEKYQQQQLNHHNNNNNHRPGTNSVALNNQHSGLASGSKLLSTNEASPQIAANMNTQHTNISNLFEPQDGAKKMSPDQWFKPSTIESSVSAADSTAENQLSANADRAASLRTNAGVMLNGCLSYHHSHPTSAGIQSDLNPVSRQNEMKVLSSLLNSNLDRALPTTDSNLIVANHQTNNCAIWRTPCNQNIDIQNQNPTSNQTLIAPGAILNNDLYTSNQQTQQTHQQISSNSQYNQNTSSIPPNGRPITLTPLVSNNVMISQRQAPPQILTQPQQQPQQAPQQQQQTSIKSKAPTFVQPASPSASSTTSSSGNTEIGSSSTSVAPVKRQKDFNQTKSSDRSARPNSLSTECSLSSHDEGFSSQIDQDDCANSMRADSDDDSDIDSDDESFYGDYTNSDLIGASISDNPECKWTLTMGRTRRNGQKRFFWQYNVQSKGPKGTRISSADGSENPFVLPEASDPVFSNDCQIEGVKHSGKARRGDGNDLTPNPKKLLMIGLELKKLSKIINDLAPVTDLPINARNKTRKEKNKLASRACRLKKKAQHEANKIKLYGLQREHQQVVMAIYDIRKFLRESLAQDHIKQEAQQSLKDKKLGTYVKSLVDQCSITVAGKTSDYVNSVLEKVVSGFIDGGL